MFFLMPLLIFFCFMSNIYAANYVPIKDSKGVGLALSSSPYATTIGQQVLEKGGNAIDAAVAMGYALAVTHPAAGNIGGGGFALIHLANGENLALDFREKSPLAATHDMFLDSKKDIIPNAATIGYLSIATPGMVKGMSAMLEKYGTKSLANLLQPAIQLAQNGFIVTQRQSETMEEAQQDFMKFPSSRAYFLKKDGSVYQDGDILIQKDLAKTLRILQKDGAEAFYRGEIGNALIKDIQKNGGILTKQDLENYNVTWRKPIYGTYRGYEIISMPPPSSGGTHIVQILNVLENANIASLGFHSSQSIHLMVEAMRQAYADRAAFMGDSDFIKIPLDILTSKEYAKKIFTNITKNAMPSNTIKAGLDSIKQPYSKANFKEGANTTHYSIVDKWGNAVSVTYTLNKRYGSAVSLNGYGFLLNDQMENFAIKTGVPNRHGLIEGENNAIMPNKRPLSSMSPTIILKDKQLFMVLGTPGSGKIISTLTQVIVNIIDYKMDIAEAIQAPRFHMQWQPDRIDIEKFLLNADTIENLKKMGYRLMETEYMGDVNAIIIDPASKIIYGSLDPRRKL
ncbi:gamma-glutamyltransferase [Helicobacter didelphidarum]